MKKLKIAIDCRLLKRDVGGIRQYVLNLLRGISAVDNHDSYIILADRDLEKLIRLALGPHANFTFVDTGCGPLSIKNQLLIQGILCRIGIDIYHSPDFIIPLIGTKRYKTVVTIHDLIPYIHPEYCSRSKKSRFSPVYRFILKRVIHLADRIITVSNHSKKDILDNFSEAGSKIEMIYNGFDGRFEGIEPANSDDLRKSYNIIGKYILYAGRQDPSKNLLGIIKAFSDLNRVKPDIRLVIAGKKDIRYTAPYEMVDRLSLAGKVIFTDYVSDRILLSLYRNASVFLFPSLYEGFGFPVLEAMSQGVPVVTSDRASLPEVAGEAALKVNPDDPAGISKTVLNILNDEVMAQRLRDAGYRRVKMFSWSSAASETIGAYRALASRDVMR